MALVLPACARRKSCLAMSVSEQQYITGCYLDRHPSLHTEHSEWKAGQVAALLSKHGIAPATMADVGCGAGAVLMQLQRTFPACDFTGYEISPGALELCRSEEH